MKYIDTDNLFCTISHIKLFCNWRKQGFKNKSTTTRENHYNIKCFFKRKLESTRN